MHYIVILQNYTISIRLRTYSSFKAALTESKVSMLGNDVYFLCLRQHVT